MDITPSLKDEHETVPWLFFIGRFYFGPSPPLSQILPSLSIHEPVYSPALSQKAIIPLLSQTVFFFFVLTKLRGCFLIEDFPGHFFTSLTSRVPVPYLSFFFYKMMLRAFRCILIRCFLNRPSSCPPPLSPVSLCGLR